MNAAWIGIPVAGLASLAGMTYAVRGRGSTFFGPSVYRGDRSRPVLALTFDDGPSPATAGLLEILDRHHTPATFFMCGENVRRHPSIAREVHAAGHEIGNHSDSHPYLHFHSPGFIRRELESAQRSIEDAAGVDPVWFRPPYGVRWFGLRGAQKDLSLTGAMWTVIGRDWKWSAARVARRLIDGASNGAILCLHDGRTLEPDPDIRPTLAAVERLIPALQDRGFQFATMTQACGAPRSPGAPPRTAK